MRLITFPNRKPNIRKLKAFGFTKRSDASIYTAYLLDGQMKLAVMVREDGSIFTEVTDLSFGGEYTLHHVVGASGSFVGRVRAEYEALLDEISTKCFDLVVFKRPQTEEVITYVREKYGDEPEYLWQKSPNNAVIRRKDSQKWYAAILTVSRRKLGVDSDESVEILDLRIQPDEMEHTVDNDRYFPGYHMNKKHWYTICLDGTVAAEELFRRIDESYLLAVK